MEKQTNIWNKLIGYCDNIAKIAAAGVVILALASYFSQTVRTGVKLASSERLGVVGIIKFETGVSKVDDKGKALAPEDYNELEMKPSTAGSISALRSGGIGYTDLERGDVLQTSSSKNIRDDNGCYNVKDENDEVHCSLSPKIFHIKSFSCLIVLKKLVKDSGKKNDKMYKKNGGWVKVATTSCGIFNE